ncbi:MULTISPECIES: ammonium transporter [Novosphingobium]|uniref:ammonium transporter n=1 Tax=Novosphingobium TaxID=165696 RepID=UPI00086C251F|nr:MULTISPECIES: ammonium transporter [Novosphingobium]MBN9145904.1 ammonium transporter [Novosphingobium sp.]MDR6710018.1 Amt family ammonium transporter [Novosphingobium sp. 1748]NKI99818.1 Amt family ammonium transporter [Novosphingobium sp. SG707]ODU81273.1 MAG: ammonia channel protein [Novosphingobium sp. SCN 63-17]OJX95871.1 MAG: ammonia channel protein [Novosphingobium sp. 63-713]
MIRKMICGAGALGASLFAATTAFAQAAPIKAPTAEQMATMVNKGDNTWMLMSSVLVLLMSIPALALFYGGLVRTKNMLSVLMQVFMIVSVAALVWVCWGYSMAFTGGSPFVGGFSKAFLMGVSASTYAATFSNNVYLPEYTYVIFQMTFACITPALIVGAFAERVKFTPLIIFTVLWLTFIYFPMAHMVWYFAGPDFLSANTSDAGYLYGLGALDFAGGTVVHINAGIAGLVGCLVIGKRVGFGKEATPPHSLTMTMIGASLLWVGWFGFNAGSNLEANGLASLAFINTFVATAAAAVSWSLVEQVKHGKPSMLGAASGAVAGLVAITPASGFAAPMTSIVLGLVVSPICFFFVSTVKNKLKYDDTLDVFGVHCIGGIVGAIGTGIVADPSLGGQGWVDYTVFPSKAGTYDMVAQVITQIKAVVLTLVLSGGGSAILFFALDKTIGLRPSEEAEREGLDITEHGERAYNY